MKRDIKILFTLLLITNQYDFIKSQKKKNKPKKDKSKECIDFNDPEGKNYMGSESRTQVQRNGKPVRCLAWESEKTKKIAKTESWKKNIEIIRRQDGNAEHNYCRNPDGSNFAWCYVDPELLDKNGKNWEYCKFIKTCKNKGIPDSLKQNKPEPMCGISCKQGYQDCVFDLSKSSGNPQSRMIGAQPANPGEFPWMASLYDPCYTKDKRNRCNNNTSKKNTKGQVFCGASILNKNWLLTAAHCVVKSNSRAGMANENLNYHTFKAKKNGKGEIIQDEITRVLALVGYNDWSKTPDQTLEKTKRWRTALGRDEIPIFQFIAHENYMSEGVQNDIALAQLDRPINYNNLMDLGGMSLVRPICIPSADLEESMLKAQREKVKVNGIKELTEKAKQLKKCYLSGHGDTNGTFVDSDDRDPASFPDVTVLQKGMIPLYGTKKCKKAMANMGHELHDYQTCGFDQHGEDGEKVDACQGDSGGPYVCPMDKDTFHPALKKLDDEFQEKNKNVQSEDNENEVRRMVQFGIVSFGFECGKTPGIYTKVSFYNNWMKNIMAEASRSHKIEDGIQVIDISGNVMTQKAKKKGRLGFQNHDVQIKKEKYCKVKKNFSKNGSYIKLRKNQVAKIIQEKGSVYYLAATKKQKKGWAMKRYCTVVSK